MNDLQSFRVVYDRRADVLYISKGHEPTERGIEDAVGVVWRYSKSGELVGATVMDFDDVWHHKHADLARRLSQQFAVPAKQARAMLDHIASER